jgi:hypothetical protein
MPRTRRRCALHVRVARHAAEREFRCGGLQRALRRDVDADPNNHDMLVHRLKQLLVRYRDEIVRLDEELTPQIIVIAEQLRQARALHDTIDNSR